MLSPIECFALDFAAHAHAKQVDKQGRCYLAHCIRVAMAVRRLDDPHYFMTGILHDVIEDTPVCFSQVLYTFGRDLANAVNSVTRDQGPNGVYREAYDTFVRRAAQHPIGRVVKLADVRDNLMPERMNELPEDVQARLKAKYTMALEILEGQ